MPTLELPMRSLILALAFAVLVASDVPTVSGDSSDVATRESIRKELIRAHRSTLQVHRAYEGADGIPTWEVFREGKTFGARWPLLPDEKSWQGQATDGTTVRSVSSGVIR